ncbi:MAG TPA: hypothetical protein ENI67_09130 [Gammaproteobacteria bacterium]|nr:hypothetical protein [Gammaproteobacteria bacterium]
MINKTGLGLLLVVLGSFSVVNTANARWAVPLLNPGPTSWGCDLSMSAVKKGINTGLIAKNWIPSNEQTGYTQGKIVVRGKHTLVVDIDYTKSSFDIKYKSSKNLKHSIDSAGVEKIHPNANSWMDNLKNAITTVLKGQCN